MKRLGWVSAGLIAVLAALIGIPEPALAQSVVEVRILYLEQALDRPPALSNIDEIPEDLGLGGARLGIEDNATTGRFLGQDYVLDTVVVEPGGDLLGAASQALADGHRLIVANLPPDDLLAVADLPEAADALILNAAARDDRLRQEDCRANLLHTIPSRAMLTDGLTQFLAWRRWTDWFLVVGPKPEDKLFAEALRRSAKRFGAKIDEEKAWTFDADLRRSARSEIPAFTQVGDYEVLVVADEIGDFGEYLPYNTWLPRPVAGTQGLKPVAWDRVVEQWGAAQVQNRFEKLMGRSMRAIDYAAWSAVRTVGEAVTRTGKADAKTISDYVLGPDFELAAFKGRALTYRPWSGQMRQTIPLVTGTALVIDAPIEGFLHPVSELDTLGFDEPESTCENR